jgi:hypothetical protein
MRIGAMVRPFVDWHPHFQRHVTPVFIGEFDVTQVPFPEQLCYLIEASKICLNSRSERDPRI